MIHSVYRISDGKYCGCTANPQDYDPEQFGFTDQSPPVFDDLQNQMPYWTGTQWEIRTLN